MSYGEVYGFGRVFSMFARCLLSFGEFPRDVASFCEFLRIFGSLHENVSASFREFSRVFTSFSRVLASFREFM